MVANAKFDELDLTDSRNQELHAEIRFLREELQMVTAELAAEKAKRRKRKRSKRGRTDTGDGISIESDENVYVFDDEDETRAAFDDFFSTPDPHLDKVRGFLLD